MKFRFVPMNNNNKNEIKSNPRNKKDKRDKRYSSLSAFVITCVASLLTLVALTARATITLSPARGGSLGKTGSFYYFVQFPGSTPTPASPAFKTFEPLDISKSVTDEVNSGLNNMFRINFNSNVSTIPPAPQQALVMVIVNASGASLPVPIAAVNGQHCGGTTNLCQAQGLNNADNNNYYAAKYTPNQSIEIGIYPRDICAALSVKGIQSQACTGAFVVSPRVGTTTNFSLSFVATTAADSQILTAPSPTPTGQTFDTLPNPINLVLQVDTPTFTCPSQEELKTSYIPGDAQIVVKTSLFRLVTSPGSAPAAQLYVVGQDNGSAPVTGSNYARANTYVSGGLSLGFPTQNAGGFVNSTEDDRHSYELSFLMQDDAGIFVPPNDPISCRLGPVETGAIEGFLKKSNCFIATAAFGSGEAAPVQMLRDFRDEILFQSALGTSFVHWYYEWSPGWADWMMDHTAVRLPVLLLLAPLELIAWFCLNPFYFVILLSFVFSGLWILFLMSSRKCRAEMLRQRVIGA